MSGSNVHNTRHIFFYVITFGLSSFPWWWTTTTIFRSRGKCPINFCYCFGFDFVLRHRVPTPPSPLFFFSWPLGVNVFALNFLHYFFIYPSVAPSLLYDIANSSYSTVFWCPLFSQCDRLSRPVNEKRCGICLIAIIVTGVVHGYIHVQVSIFIAVFPAAARVGIFLDCRFYCGRGKMFIASMKRRLTHQTSRHSIGMLLPRSHTSQWTCWQVDYILSNSGIRDRA